MLYRSSEKTLIHTKKILHFYHLFYLENILLPLATLEKSTLNIHRHFIVEKYYRLTIETIYLLHHLPPLLHRKILISSSIAMSSVSLTKENTNALYIALKKKLALPFLVGAPCAHSGRVTISLWALLQCSVTVMLPYLFFHHVTITS
jgi:hypothetical protein